MAEHGSEGTCADRLICQAGIVNDPFHGLLTNRDSAAGKKLSKAFAVTTAIDHSDNKMAEYAFTADQHGEMQ